MTKKKPPKQSADQPRMRQIIREGGPVFQERVGGKWRDVPVVHFPKPEDGSR
jgi:hypothetical protein